MRIFWKLKKTLYGLKDSPRIFNEELTNHLTKCGYVQAQADKCLFYKGKITGAFILMVLIVDDFAVGATSDELIDELKAHLESKYTITEKKTLESFLGIHISYNHNGSITLTMPGYLTKLCTKYLSQDDTPLQTPMITNFNDEFQNDAPPCDQKLFQTMIGEFIFTLKVRIDVCVAISKLSHRARPSPTTRDLSAAKHLLRFFLGTIDVGITYYPATSDRFWILNMKTFCDAAWNIHMDSKSQLGLCLSLGGHPDTGMIHASSSRSKTVALSSTEAEADALVDLTKHVIWYYTLLKELGFDVSNPAYVGEDNASLITLVRHYSGNHKRVKHFLLKINFLIEQVNNRIIDPNFIKSPDNCSDTLTKPLGPTEYLAHQPKILGKRS